MTPTQINEAIARLRGWTTHQASDGMWSVRSPDGDTCGHERCFEFECYAEFPHYHSDLNAMHEAEKTLTQKQWMSYRAILSSWCRGYTDGVSATAAQRAEAFLSVHGKWEE